MPRRLPRLAFIHCLSVFRSPGPSIFLSRACLSAETSLSPEAAVADSPSATGIRLAVLAICSTIFGLNVFRIGSSSVLIRTRVKRGSRFIASVLKLTPRARQNSSVSSRLAQRSIGRTSFASVPSSGRIGRIAARPSGPLPRIRFSKNVSAWSFTVCAVRTAKALCRSAVLARNA